jgi:hypothetical protein
VERQRAWRAKGTSRRLVDGGSGDIHLGRHDIAVERPHAELAEVVRWRGAAVLRDGTVTPEEYRISA